MENNLDDILIDPLEENQKKPKSKRWVLIGVALVLLIAVVGIVLYFVFVRKEETKGIEAVHSELEKFETFAQNQSRESQKDDEFDKLIAEIKAKHQNPSDQKAPQEEVKPSNEEMKVSEAISQAPKTQETQNDQNKDQNRDLIKALQETQGVQTKPQEKEEPQIKQEIKQDKMQNQAPKQALLQPSNAQEKVILKKPTAKIETKKTTEKKPEPKQSSKASNPPSNLSASSAFNSLEIPRGFYLQVGVFSNTPNADFLSKLSSFSYRVEKFNNKGKIVNRYLVGPFKTRMEAEAKVLEVTQKVTKPVVVEIP